MKRLLIVVLVLIIGITFFVGTKANGEYKRKEMTIVEYKNQIVLKDAMIKQLQDKIKKYDDNRRFLCEKVGVAFISN